MISDFASIKDETRHAASDSGLPGQLRLAELLATGMFEEVGGDFVADVGVWHRLSGPGAYKPYPNPG